MLKKITAFTSFICLLANITLLTSAQGTIYNPILQEMGITEEIFWDMPVDQRNNYQKINAIIETSTDIKYYKEIPSPNRSISTPMLLEVSQSEYEAGISNLNTYALQNSEDVTNGSWYKMTTILSEVERLNTRKYYITNTVDLSESMFMGLNKDKTCYIGVSINANMSPVSNTEYFRLLCTLGVSGQQIIDDQEPKTHKSAGGIAFDYDIGGMMVSGQAFMSIEVEKNVSNTTVFDGYGIAGYWSTIVNPTISIGSGGGSISISPQKKLTMAENTHVQIKP